MTKRLPPSAQTKIEAIERKAETALRKAGQREPAVDVEAVANAYGARVENADLGTDCSGVLVRKGDVAVIGVSWTHHPNRQRFTIAHEIGHLLLHKGGTYVDKGMTAQYRRDQAGSGSPEEEREANQFAAALAMPRQWVKDAFNQAPFDFGDDQSLAALAEKFGVSTQAMSYRLANLGLLQE